MKNIIIAVVATAVIVGSGAFYGGMRYAKKSATTPRGNGQDYRGLSSEERQQRMQQFGSVNGPAGGQGGGRLGGMVSGEVIAKDATSMTVKLRDGGSKIVLFSNSTEVGKFVQGAMDDVVVGENVTVSGKANSDGSVTAQSIQIRPAPAAGQPSVAPR